MQISLQQVTPLFFDDKKDLVSDVWNQSIEFSKGEHIHIIAPSGSGKTSLIHFLYGLRKDYSGKITYTGEDIQHFDSEAFAVWRQQHISIVFQDLRLFKEDTVLQNIEIKRLLAPYHSECKIEYMAERLGIKSKLHQLCKTCSYGEQQRIAIIRALQQPFDFILLDEPFSHLDENNRMKAMELIEEEVMSRNAGIILADLKKIDFFKHTRELFL